MEGLLISEKELLNYTCYAISQTPSLVRHLLYQIQVDFNLDQIGVQNLAKLLLQDEKNQNYRSVFKLVLNDCDKMLEILDLETMLQKYYQLELNLSTNDEKTNTSSFNKFSLSTHLFELLTQQIADNYDWMPCGSRNERNFDHEVSSEKLAIIKLVVQYLPHDDHHTLANVVNSTLLSMDQLGRIMEPNFNFDTMEEKVAPKGHSRHNKKCIFNAIIFRYLLECNMFNENEGYCQGRRLSCGRVMSALLIRQDLVRLEMVKLIQPSLLFLDHEGLVKMIFYGRYQALKFAIANMNKQFISIIRQSNPFQISGYMNDSMSCISVETDLINGGNCEWDDTSLPNPAEPEFTKTFELIKSYTAQYSRVQFGVNELKLWLEERFYLNNPYERSYRQVTIPHQRQHFFMSPRDLLLQIKIDIETREGLLEMIKLLGKETAWQVIKNCDSGVMELLF